MQVGITGHQGFVGSEVAEVLAAAGHGVVNLDAYCRRPDPDTLGTVPARLDWVLHFAARTSIADSQRDPDGFLRDNLAATRAALDVAASRGAALLYMSSYVYGQPRYNPIDESHPVAELNPYMASKLAGERLASSACAALGLPLVILRPFSLYGRRRQPGRLVSDLLDCLRTGRPLAVNDPNPRRDHLYASDFSALARAIVEQVPVREGVFNVGSGVTHSNQEVADMLRLLAGEPRPVEVHLQPRGNDVLECVADLRKVSATFGWQPRWPLQAGLAELVRNLPAQVHLDPPVTPGPSPPPAEKPK